MKKLPKTRFIDSSFRVLQEGNRFISNRCDRLGSDAFQTRILFSRTVCMRGEEAAKAFYNRNLISRKKGMPSSVKKTLTGVGGIQGMDKDPHLHRKQMFMSLMTKQGIEDLMGLMMDYWNVYLEKWENKKKIIFFDQTSKLIMEAVCEWCGVPLKKKEVDKKTSHFQAMIDGAGSIGWRNIKGRRGRKKAEKWIKKLIKKVRKGKLEVRDGSALKKIAMHRDHNNELLDPQIAAVELMNVIRPTVAVARWMAFMAVALEEHPEYRAKIKEDEEYVEYFVQETRRYYSFFPFLAGYTLKEFTWNGYKIPENTKILLDLFGTNRDKKTWKQPEEFKPERFENWDQNAFNFIPQGGGDHHTNHRCPGEWIAIDSLKLGLKVMANYMTYTVPGQDLGIDDARMPMVPKSGFIMKGVKRVEKRPVNINYEFSRN